MSGRQADAPTWRARLRRLLVAAVLQAPLVVIPGGLTTAEAADDGPGLAVQITEVSPPTLRRGLARDERPPIEIAGTVTNRDDREWTDAQAYLVVPRAPFTAREQFDAAVRRGELYTGERVVDLGTFDELGDLPPGETLRFRVRVPYRQLGVVPDAGVFPIGVQILATEADGAVDAIADGRATTFLPSQPRRDAPVDTALIWPMLNPLATTPAGTWDEPERLLRQIGDGGRLRHRLDAIRNDPSLSRVLLDPALLFALDDLLAGRRLGGLTLSEVETDRARTFRAELVQVVGRDGTWCLGFDRTDVAGVLRSDRPGRIAAAVERVTRAQLRTAGLRCRLVSWPLAGTVSADLLAGLRRESENPVVVDADRIPGWQRRDGSVVRLATDAGPLPVLAVDSVSDAMPGEVSVATLRQAVLAEATLAQADRALGPGSRADAVLMVPPGLDPGPAEGKAPLTTLAAADVIAAATIDGLLTPRSRTLTSAVRGPRSSALPARQLAAVRRLADITQQLGGVLDDAEAALEHDRDLAWVTGTRWRGRAPAAVARTLAAQSRLEAELDALTVQGPESVTLSGSRGSFPLTVSNDSPHPVRVGIELDSSNPALTVPPVDPVQVDAGERVTVTVNVDVGAQTSTTLTARLSAADGTGIGADSTFNVRSSGVGTALWIAIAAAAAFVILALVRRFRRSTPEPTGPHRISPEEDTGD